MTRRFVTLLLLGSMVSGCAASPYDFAVPVMVDGRQATSMTGYMATDNEAEVRARLAGRMGCPGEVDFLSLQTQRADNALGSHILHYDVVMRCAEAAS